MVRTEHREDFDNPLFDHLIEHQSVPNGCVEPWLVYILAMISLFSAVLSILFFDRGFPAGFDNADVIGYTFRIIWSPALITPIITAFVAAMITVRTIRQSSFELIAVSGLSDEKIVQGFVFSTWYWLRSWMTWQVGFAPLLIAGMINLYSKLRVGATATILMPLLLTASFAGIIYLTLTLSVALGLRWQQWLTAALVSIFVAMIAVFALILLILTPTGMVIPKERFSSSIWLMVGFITTFTIIASGAGIEWFAQRWVRKITQ